MDHARPERLRDLVLALLPTYPDVEVYTDVRAVYEVPEGAVMVLAPRAEDADWLNQQRPVFARRKLKVILWCDAETSVALSRKAVDFFDWISHRHECPPGVPMHAVYGIRAALCARAKGIVWLGDNLEACFRVALPGRRLVHLSARMPQDDLVQAMRNAGRAWLVLHDTRDAFDEMQVWGALKRLHIRTRVFWIRNQYMSGSGLWLLDDRCRGLAEARAVLADLGARAPGRLGALTGLEPEAVQAIELGLWHGVSEAEFERSMRSATDAGAAAVRLVERHVPRTWVSPRRALLWRATGRDWSWWLKRPPEASDLAWRSFFAAEDAIQRGELHEANEWAQASFTSAGGARGHLNVEHANALRVLGLIGARERRFEEATEDLREALRIAEIRLGGENPFLGGLYGDLAEILAQKGDFDEAKRLAERAFQIEKSIPSLSSPYMSRSYKRFAYIQSLEDVAAAQVQGGVRGSE